MNSYNSRPISTWSGIKKHPIKELGYHAARGCRKVVSSRIGRSILRRLSWLRPEEGESLGESVIHGMMVESVERVPANEAALVSMLVSSLRAAKQRQSEVTGTYLPGAEWKKLLESQWFGLHQAIDRKDIGAVAAFLRNFFRNEGLSGFWGGERMFDNFAALDGVPSRRRASNMERHFRAWRKAFPKVPVAQLDAPRIGNPWGYVIEGALLYEPVFEYHYHANYFEKLLTGLSEPVVLEIGGGFGGLAYQIIKSIRRVRYIGFDLPENILLQSYYLSCAFPEASILTYDENMRSLSHDTVAKYDIVLLPNFMIPHVEPAMADLVVNVRSLSEMPMETIAEYLSQIDRLSRLFFFHENLFNERLDGLHGIPSTAFPALTNHTLAAEKESMWPKYQQDSPYPCHENLYLHRSRVRR